MTTDDTASKASPASGKSGMWMFNHTSGDRAPLFRRVATSLSVLMLSFAAAGTATAAPPPHKKAIITKSTASIAPPSLRDGPYVPGKSSLEAPDPAFVRALLNNEPYVPERPNLMGTDRTIKSSFHEGAYVPGLSKTKKPELITAQELMSGKILRKTLQPLAKSFSHAIDQAIIKAGERVGINPDFLAYTVNAESEGNLFAKSISETSTSKGPAGFTDDTWMQVLKKYGASYGYPNAAAAIVVRNGKHFIPNEKDRKFILNGLRRDPNCSMLMTALLTRESALILQKNNIPTNGTKVYQAHFMGPRKAVQYNIALAEDPHRKISEILPVPIQDPANKGVLGTPAEPKKLHEVERIISRKVPPIPVFLD